MVGVLFCIKKEDTRDGDLPLNEDNWLFKDDGKFLVCVWNIFSCKKILYVHVGNIRYLRISNLNLLGNGTILIAKRSLLNW